MQSHLSALQNPTTSPTPAASAASASASASATTRSLDAVGRSSRWQS